MKRFGRHIFTDPYSSLPSGQTLVIVLLVMVTSLTVGLAVSTRTISTLKQTTFTSQSAGALAAAEAGAEEALKRLADAGDSPNCKNAVDAAPAAQCAYHPVGTTAYDGSSGPCTGGPTTFTGESGATYSYCVSMGGGSAEPYMMDLERDKTQEVSLEGYGGSTLEINWFINNFDSATPEKAALELILVSGAPGSYTMNKYALDSESARRATNGFDAPSGCAALTNFSHCHGLAMPATPQLLRIRAVYNNVSVGVKPAAASTLAQQGYQIESVGSLGGVIKKIRVTKSLPALPTIFDFGLFSGDPSHPISNQ